MGSLMSNSISNSAQPTFVSIFSFFNENPGKENNNYFKERSLEDFECLEKIGEGGEGAVYKALEKATNKLFALKIIENMPSEDERIQQYISVLSHPSLLLPLFTIKKKDAFTNKNTFYLFFDLHKQNLKEYLSNLGNENGKLSNSTIMKFFKTMIDGLTYLKSKNVAHRDLKPANILVNVDEQRTPMFFLCDFGCSKISPNRTSFNTILGTKPYISPELYESFERNDLTLKYNPFKSDIFSLGLVFLEVITLQKIVGLNKNEEKLKERLDNFNYSKEMNEIIKKMLKWNPDERIKLEELKMEVDSLCGDKKDFLANEIIVKDLTSKPLTLKFSSDDTVLDLFLRIQDKSGYRLDEFFLCFNNRGLKQKDFFKKANEFSIKAGSRLDIIRDYNWWHKYCLVEYFYSAEYKSDDHYVFLSKVEERYAVLINDIESNYKKYEKRLKSYKLKIYS